MFENLTTETTETPEPVTATPWYRRWYTITAAIAVIAGAVATAGLLYLTSSGASPASVLKADGYSAMMTLSPSQLSTFAGSGGSELTQYISGAVAGTKDGQIEMVVGLTHDGETYVGSATQDQISSLAGSLPKGATAHMSHGDIVINGPLSSFGS
jgi:hypothetical protein